MPSVQEAVPSPSLGCQLERLDDEVTGVKDTLVLVEEHFLYCWDLIDNFELPPLSALIKLIVTLRVARLGQSAFGWL